MSREALVEIYIQIAEIASPSEAMRAFAQSIGESVEASVPNLTGRFRAAIVSPAQVWQSVFAACGLSPGANA